MITLPFSILSRPTLLSFAFVACAMILSVPAIAVAQPEADLSVTKIGPEQFQPNQQATYQITVANNGPDPADFATMTDVLPSQLVFVSLAAPAGWICTTPPAGSNGTITCQHSSIETSSGPQQFLLTVRVDAAAAPGVFISNKASVSTATFDVNDENNESTASGQISGANPTDVGVLLEVDREAATAGSNLTYTIAISNVATADNVSFTSTLPPDMSFQNISQPSGWNCVHPALGNFGNVTCSTAVLEPGNTVFTLIATLPRNAAEGAFYTNSVTTTTSSPDVNSENDTATASTVIEAYSLSITAGASQTTPIETAFATQLQVTVTVSGAPRSGVPVTFRAPEIGPSGKFAITGTNEEIVITDDSGTARTSTLTANSIAGGPYQVVALAGTTSQVSFSLTNSKGNQTISFPPIPPITYGHPPLGLVATSSASLPIIFEVLSGPGNVNGTTLTIVGAGLISIRASQPGNSNYYAAASVTQTLNVNKVTPPSMSIISSANPSDYGELVTFRITVSGSINTGAPTGSIQLKDGTSIIHSGVPCVPADNKCSAEISTSSLAPGNHSISAIYNGNSNYFSASASLPQGQTVNQLPALSISHIARTEGNQGKTAFDFLVSLSAPTHLTVTVNYSTIDSEATAANSDYDSSSGVLTFTPGQSAKTVTVRVNGDLNRENDERFFVGLSTASNASLAQSQGIGTILNDDTIDPPQLLLEENGPVSNQAAAVDSLLSLRDPFAVKNPATWFQLNQYENTRVVIFVTALQLNSNESPSSVTVSLSDSTGVVYDVPADDVRATTLPSATQITFTLPDNLASGPCNVVVRFRGLFSNQGVIRIK